MALPLNPMQINGPNSSGNFIQPDYRVPTVAANVGSTVVGADEQNLQQPITRFVQPGINGPNGTFPF